MMKTCKQCGIFRNDFARMSKSSDGLQHYCKECSHSKYLDWKKSNPGKMAANTKKWRDANLEKCREVNRNSSLKNRYGLTTIEYNILLEKQNHVCAICNNPESMVDKRSGNTRRLAVDHCADSGKIRGILCKACNTSIGGFNHDVSLMLKAIEYLKLTEK